MADIKFKRVSFSKEDIGMIMNDEFNTIHKVIKPQPDFDVAWKNVATIGGKVANLLMDGLYAPATEVPEIVVDSYWLGVRSENGFGIGVCVPNIPVYCHKGDILWQGKSIDKRIFTCEVLLVSVVNIDGLWSWQITFKPLEHYQN